MSRVSNIIAIALAALVAAGCGPDGPSKADTGLLVGAAAGGMIGSQAGRGSGAGALAGALIGGIVGHEIGSALDEDDRLRAREAEYEALENGQSGSPRSWRNPDNGHYGDVVPNRPYKRGATDCRDYTHTVYVGGRQRTMRGTACRNRDGTWSSV
ncbi:MAG: glycine zipper 2TM domain-containing protein [Hyphomicrobiaceae bacterium]|nr:glycine zipper 2TM domain-containing protein [Hyphomicrobiaceae bacterium]